MDRVSYFIRRLLLVVPTIIGITFVCFAICQFVPGGPVEQALIRMRDIAPQYLEGFIAHVDALFWLERADPGRGAAGRGAAPKVGARKGEARARSGRTRRQSRGAEG